MEYQNNGLDDQFYMGALVGFNLLSMLDSKNELFLNVGAKMDTMHRSYDDSGSYLKQEYWKLPIELEGELSLGSLALLYGVHYTLPLTGTQSNGVYSQKSKADLKIQGYELGAKLGASYTFSSVSAYTYAWTDYTSIKETPQNAIATDTKNTRFDLQVGLKAQLLK